MILRYEELQALAKKNPGQFDPDLTFMQETRGNSLKKALNYFPTINDELTGTNREVALAICEISKMYQSFTRLRRRKEMQYSTTNPYYYQYRYLY